MGESAGTPRDRHIMNLPGEHLYAVPLRFFLYFCSGRRAAGLGLPDEEEKSLFSAVAPMAVARWVLPGNGPWSPKRESSRCADVRSIPIVGRRVPHDLIIRLFSAFSVPRPNEFQKFSSKRRLGPDCKVEGADLPRNFPGGGIFAATGMPQRPSLSRRKPEQS